MRDRAVVSRLRNFPYVEIRQAVPVVRPRLSWIRQSWQVCRTARRALLLMIVGVVLQICLLSLVVWALTG